MKYTGVGELPHHLYAWVDRRFIYKNRTGFERAVWFGLVSHPSRMWGCTVMLESGAVYRNLPPHALAFSEKPTPVWLPQSAQTWDCYGRSFTTVKYQYLTELNCVVKTKLEEVFQGSYLFTAYPIEDGFSEYPEQSKEFSFIELENGRLTVQPTDRVCYIEGSFTTSASRRTGSKGHTGRTKDRNDRFRSDGSSQLRTRFPTRRQVEVYSCE